MQLLRVGLHRIIEQFVLERTLRGHLVQHPVMLLTFELKALAQAFLLQVLPFQFLYLHPTILLRAPTSDVG